MAAPLSALGADRDERPAPVSGPPVLLLMGPTASGKTDLALGLVDALAADIPCELVSVDSALVYRGMDIGTAKPSADLLAAYPHRLVDICDPAEAYSAARFVEDARVAIDDIRGRGHLPLLVGGTMLYVRALLRGLAVLPEADATLRAELTERAEQLGPEGMHGWLAEVDPTAAERIHPNDPQRVQRALEVYLVAGRPMTELWRTGAEPFALPVLKLARSPRQRALLHERIERRFDAMLDAGFAGEVSALMARGDLTPELPSMRCVGYRQMWGHLAGEFDAEEMRRRGIVATRQLAKRQYTWLRSEPDVHWLWDDAEPERKALDLVHAALDLRPDASA